MAQKMAQNQTQYESQRLTAARVRSLRGNGKTQIIADPHGKGLRLRVTPRGSKSWTQRLSVDGRKRNLGLGSAELLSLEDARHRAYENWRAARTGSTLVTARASRQAALTFRQLAERAIREREMAGTWKNGGMASKWQASLERWIYPAIGELPVAAIARADILAAFNQNAGDGSFWSAYSKTAGDVLNRVRIIFDLGVALDLIAANPAGPELRAALPKAKAEKRHMATLPHGEIAGCLRRIDGSVAGRSVKLAIRLAALTATRSQEVRGATWAEIDMEAGIWTLPASRTKTNAELPIPLSTAARKVLGLAIAAKGKADGLVFPSPKGGALGSDALSMAFRRLAPGQTLHGLRSAFRDWAAESGYDGELAERALNHLVPGKVQAAYLRTTLLDQRRELMQKWGEYLSI